MKDCRCIDLKGKGYLRIKGEVGNFKFAGNMSQIELSPSLTTNTVKDYTSAAGGNACSSTTIDAINVNMTFNCLDKDVLIAALAGVATASTATVAVVEEPHTVASDCVFVPLNGLVDKSVAVVVTNVVEDSDDLVTYVVGEDYIVTGTGLEIPEGSAIDGAILVSYSQRPFCEIDLYQNISREYEFVFDGVVNNATRDPFGAYFYKVKFTPATAFNLITDGFGDIQVTGELLKDPTKINADGDSQFGIMNDIYIA